MKFFREYISKLNEASLKLSSEVKKVKEDLKNLGYILAPQQEDKNPIVVLCPDENRILLLNKISKEASLGKTKIEQKESSIGRIVLQNGVRIIVKNANTDGSLKKNKGNEFEVVFHNALIDYISDKEVDDYYKSAIDDIIKIIPSGFSIIDAKSCGSLNQKRPIHITDKGMYCGDGDNENGKTVADEIIIISNGKTTKEVYLSLKSGSSVTLANIGISKIVPGSEITSGEITNKLGVSFLNFLGLNNEQFCKIFNDYVEDRDPITGKIKKKQTLKNEVDVTNLYKSGNMQTFLKSLLGYGYVFVHQYGGKIHIKRLDKKDRDSLVEVKSAKILYPKDGSAKRVDILVDCTGIELKLNIRSKDGGTMPTHIMCDYRFK